MTLENRGKRELRWTNDGCDIHAGVSADMDARWPRPAADLPADLLPYRDWFLDEVTFDDRIWLTFPVTWLASRRFAGCADLGIGRSLAPGRSFTQEFVWDGQAAGRLGLPPSGPVTLSATFDRWTRPGPGAEGRPITATLESWVIDGRPGDTLAPAEVLDAALRDERFAAVARSRALHTGNIVFEYDLHLGIWAIGFLSFPEHAPVVMVAAFVDPISGEVIDVRQQRVEF